MSGSSAKLVELVNAFETAEDINLVARSCVEFLRNSPEKEKAHRRLCCAMVKRAEGGNAELNSLLHFSGDMQLLDVVYANIAHAKLPVAKWLSSEVLKLLKSGAFASLLLSMSRRDPASSRLSPIHEHLVGVVCRLPDVLANRLGRQLKEGLFPAPYFRQLGRDLLECLESIHVKWKGSGCGYSLLFPAAVLGTAATLGHQGAVMESLLPALEKHVTSEPSWGQLSQQLFALLPPTSLDPVVETLINRVSPSLLPSSPFSLLIGRDVLSSNHKAKFLLGHKLILVRIPSSPDALYNLLGYLASCEAGRELLRKSLQSALGVWSDVTSVRHMDSRQHTWISRVLVLGVALLRSCEGFAEVKQGYQKLIMMGVQVHIQSPLPEVRHIGMVVGESLMNLLHNTGSHKEGEGEGERGEVRELKFEYPESEVTRSLKGLVRPVAEQEAELKEKREKEEREGGGVVCDEGGEKGQTKQSKERLKQGVRSLSPSEQKFGEGYAHAVDCSDSDSDDDLVPYAMDDDYDSTQPTPPRYLRTLMQDLLATKEPQKVEVALRAAESLIRSQLSDLEEVCVELCKLLLHLSDTFALEDFLSRRHKAMVALLVLCPALVTPYLTGEFYGINYSLRHRLDILEVISAAALELSQPTASPSAPLHPPPSPSPSPHWTSRKPWEQIVSQRLQAKTRTISKGPTKPAPKAVANRFTDVAPLFFFPLMNRFDQPVKTLDLLGEDSLVLGNLLYTLGTVMYAASNLPVTGHMAVAFMDFLWIMRYHHDAYVRQGVLYGLGMLIAATPAHTLLGELSTGLMEGVAWMKEVLSEDADEQSRMLAGHALTLLNTAMKES